MARQQWEEVSSMSKDEIETEIMDIEFEIDVLESRLAELTAAPVSE